MLDLTIFAGTDIDAVPSWLYELPGMAVVA